MHYTAQSFGQFRKVVVGSNPVAGTCCLLFTEIFDYIDIQLFLPNCLDSISQSFSSYLIYFQYKFFGRAEEANMYERINKKLLELRKNQKVLIHMTLKT